jgi:PAS domain S-box-containing protein
MRKSSLIRTLIISLFLLIGLSGGVLLASAFGNQGLRYVAGLAGVVLVVLVLLSARLYLSKEREGDAAAQGSEQRTEVGFVVDTFHDVVASLKEKEKELETLRGLAEEKAVSMEAYNDNILQSVPSGVITVDNKKVITSINQAAERILGISRDSVLESRYNEVLREPFATLFDEGKSISRAEYQYVADGGRHLWLGITTSQLKNSRGEKIGLIVIFTDLTDIKALEAQVELKQRLSELGEMSAGISHELRNSMSVIAGYAKLLGKNMEGKNKATVEAIQSEIGSMDRIISELLAFAKPSVIHTEDVLIHDLVKETASAVLSDNRSVTFSMKDAGPVTAKVDAVLFRQALSNIFMNALEAMPEGGRIDAAVSSDPGRVEIKIRDTGHGIPGNIKDRIFLPFFTTKESGTGFGLALVQKIIISHGGSIDVESTEGEGTLFRIVLPVSGSPV